MTESSSYKSVQVFIDVDVGKGTHHDVAVNPPSMYLLDNILSNNQNKLRSLPGKSVT